MLRKNISILLSSLMFFSSAYPAFTVKANGDSRNLAYRRAAYQSSSHNVNETAQLVTDGIIEPIENEKNMAYNFAHKNGNSSRWGNVKYLFDKDNPYNEDRHFETYSTSTWVQVSLPRPMAISSYSVQSGEYGNEWHGFPRDWRLEGSNDGTIFENVDTQSGITFANEWETKKFYSAPKRNLAIGATATASSSATAEGHLPQNAVDGDAGTRWAIARELWDGDNPDPIKETQWYQLDLGEAQTFSSVTLSWEGAYGKDYDIQISNDGTDGSFQTIFERRGHNGGTDTMNFLPVTARYVRFQGVATGTSWGYSFYEFEIYTDAESSAPSGGGQNIALNASVEASSSGSGEPATNAVDGNPETRWASEANDNEHFTVDLGTPKVVSSVVIDWENAYGKDYDIQLSNDGENFTTITARRNNNRAGKDFLHFEPTTAQYVRFQGVTRGSSYGYSFYEFEINTELDNLALDSATIATASSNENSWGFPERAVDGKMDTRWAVGSETDVNKAWFQIDLLEPKLVSSVTIDWEGAYGKKYHIQVSNDGENFTTVATREDHGGGKDTLTFPTTEARYVRLQGVECNNPGWGYSIFEFGVYAPSANKAYSYYRLNIDALTKQPTGHGPDRMAVGGWDLFDKYGNSILMPYNESVFSFNSSWMSAGNGEEWVFVDLGASSVIDKAKVFWGSMYATEYEIQISNQEDLAIDATFISNLEWTTVATQENGTGADDELTFVPIDARYVRLLLKTPAPGIPRYIVREFEVYGTNDLTYQLDSMPEPSADGTQLLSGGNWKVERALEVDAVADATADPEVDGDDADALGRQLASAGYNDASWVPAMVPGTVATSYIEAGIIANSIYADWQRNVSDSYFKSNFWYRNQFEIPADKSNEKVWLNFNAINWKAEVYFNGERLGNIRGGFTRGKFDVSQYANYGGQNYLAVLIYKNTDPGTAYVSNDDGPGTMGGVFGNDGRIAQDAPTFVAAGGWDWVPTVRGRNIGIYNDVFLSYTKDLSVIDPWVITTFERNGDNTMDLSKANLELRTEVQNNGTTAAITTVKGTIDGVGEAFSKQVTIPAGETVEVIFDPYRLTNPRVWWPNGYGEQPLYDITVSADDSDSKSFKFGVREIELPLDISPEKSSKIDPNGYKNGELMNLYCNGVRIILLGGNWGLEEIHHNLTAEDYDEKIRLHKYENFNMIRNWGGQTNDPELYKACDKYGILIWDDFFIPGCWSYNARDVDMFLDNAEDKVKQYRSHASLAFYCGANEMYPEVLELEQGIRELVLYREGDLMQRYKKDSSGNVTGVLETLTRKRDNLDHTRWYLPNSAGEPAVIDGPHYANPPKYYFNNTIPRAMNSERGMPNIPVAETMKKMLTPEKLWPQNEMWALHDFPKRWNVGGEAYLKKLANDYGAFDNETIDGFDEMMRRAHMQAYELHRGMFEGSIGSDAAALLMWMSNPAWPSMVWQSYDYFHDINGGYSGIAAACQPINLIWNAVNNNMILFNGNPATQNLKAVAELYDINGKLIHAQSAVMEMTPGKVDTAFTLKFPDDSSELQFIKTRVENENGDILGENFYWHNINAYQYYAELDNLPEVEVDATYQLLADDIQTEFGTEHKYLITVTNNSDTPALLNRIKVMAGETGERVLPVFYEENYFSLMPGDRKSVTLEFKEKNLNGEDPRFEIEGWNIKPSVMTENTDNYYVSNVKYLMDGQEKGSVMEAGDYTASFDVTANVDLADFKGSTSIVLYKDNRIVDVKTKPFQNSLSKGETLRITSEAVTVPGDIEEDIEKYAVRGFLWDDYSTLFPLKNTVAIMWRELGEQGGFGRNIAIGAATSSNHPYSTERAVDGDITTEWGTDWKDDQWLVIDLGERKTFSSILIDWQENNYAESYTIGISDDGQNFTWVADRENGRGGTDRIALPAGTTARYVKWQGIKRASGYGYGILEFSIIDNSTTNKAAGAVATASSAENDLSASASRVVDGDLSTRWTAADHNEPFPAQWILLDLGAIKSFAEVDMYWEAAYAKNYKISISDTPGGQFTEIVNATIGRAGLVRHKFSQVNARYVRIDMIERGTGWKYSLYEIGLY